MERACHRLSRGGDDCPTGQKDQQHRSAGYADEEKQTLPANEGDDHRAQRRTEGHAARHRAEQPAERPATLLIRIQPTHERQC
jgi:hypothetical protein